MTDQESFLQDLESEQKTFNAVKNDGITEITVSPNQPDAWIALFDSTGKFIIAGE